MVYRLFKNAMLEVEVEEETHTCGMDQLCVVLVVDIAERIHYTRMVWFHHSTEEELGFLLVGACSAFKNNNYTGMLWTVRNI